MHAVPSAFDLAFDCIIFSSYTKGTRKSQSCWEQGPKSQNDSKENFRNEMRTEKGGTGATCKINAQK